MLRNTCLIIFTLFIFFVTHKASAQNGSLTGKLVDEKGAAIGYANIALLKATDTALVAGALSNKEGGFTIKTPTAGAYLLRFSAIGFAETKTVVFNVATADFSKDFGVI